MHASLHAVIILELTGNTFISVAKQRTSHMNAQQ